MLDDKISTETKILEAATQEFMTKGYAAARTTAIAEAAGVTHGMLHYYFRTKENLFERIIADKAGLFVSVMTESMTTSSTDIFELLRSIINSHLDFLAENPQLPGFLLREVLEQPERKEILYTFIEQIAPKLILHIQNIIDRNAAEGKCRAINSKQLVLDLVSLNVFPFMAAPLTSVYLPGVATISPEFIAARKQHNYEILVNTLRP